jgi:nitroimidazol reductase NimA-like FMN-containing flavoprotein (pyridoxamine 5'-phosphate oxidase superfamily)
MSEHPDLDAHARAVIDANRYLVLGTLDPDGEARLSPVYFTHVDYAEFYWISSPASHHSQNLQRHPSLNVVVFDSSAPIGAGQCVYVHADAAVVPDAEVAEHCRAAFSGDLRGASAYSPEELSGDSPLRLYRAEATSYDVHVRGRDPVHGTGIDRRMPADPRDVED